MPNPLIQASLVDPVTKSLLEAISSGSAAGGVGTSFSATRCLELGGSGAYRTTVLTLLDVPLTVRDTQQGGGVKIYTFPQGKIYRQGASAEGITITTTSDPTATLNVSVTGQFGVGSTTQANTTLATTEQDIVQVTAFTASSAVNVPSAAVRAYGVPSVTLLDGSVTPIDVYFNVAVATATDIDADATVLVNGVLTLNWLRV